MLGNRGRERAGVVGQRRQDRPGHHVHRDDVRVEAGREERGVRKGAPRRLGEVGREHDPAVARRRGLAARSHDQHRPPGVREHLLRHAPQEEGIEGAAAVGGHDDEVRLQCVDVAQDRDVGEAGRGRDVVVDHDLVRAVEGRRGHLEQRPRLLRQRPAELLLAAGGPDPARGRDLERVVDRHRGGESRGQQARVPEGPLGLRGEVGREEDAADGRLFVRGGLRHGGSF